MPQPIDPHTELGRIAAAERIQQVADRASLAAQQRAAQQAQEDLVNRETQVAQPEQKGPEIDPDPEGRQPRDERGRRRPARAPADPGHLAAGMPVVDDGEQRHQIDISI
jgi:hypothetical protein